ncbi:MAG: hypothetical protein OET79_12030 [Nitrospirota bacterium]|nr:hypothetical protein [Nitrospirota bacterium]
MAAFFLAGDFFLAGAFFLAAAFFLAGAFLLAVFFLADAFFLVANALTPFQNRCDSKPQYSLTDDHGELLNVKRRTYE